MAYQFIASHISRRDNVLFPDKLSIDDTKVTFYKGRVIGHEETTIMRSNIGSVSINSKLFFADIIIETNGGQITRAEGFSKKDAKRILDLLSN